MKNILIITLILAIISGWYGWKKGEKEAEWSYRQIIWENNLLMEGGE